MRSIPLRLAVVVAAFLTSLLGPASRAAATPKARPNIVFAFADDWGRHAGAYARIDGPGTMNDVIRTPNFDRLAQEGVLFRDAFVSAPSCTPCRSALVSGQHFWRAGRASILNGAVWDGSLPAWPLLLRDAGYHLGKYHKVWSPGNPADAPYGGQRHAYEKAGRRFSQFSENATELVKEGRSVEEAKRILLDEVGANFDAFLADRRAGQPFCFWFGPVNTHRQWVPGSGRQLWDLDPDRLQDKLPPFLPDVPEVREDVTDYFGEAMAFDAALGVLVRRLEADGELDNTVIVVSGDHGAPGFPHGKCNLYDFGVRVPLVVRWGGAKGGRVVDDLTSLTDLAPTFLELAGVQVPESVTGRSLVPLLTTERGGQVDPARDAVYFGRERHVEGARDGYLPYPQRGIRTRDHLLIINFEPDRWPLGDPYRLDQGREPSFTELATQTRVTLADEDSGPTKAWLVGQRKHADWRPFFQLAYGKRPRVELYDLRADPHQVRNVADEPRFAGTREALEKRLMDELRRTGDPRVAGDGKYHERPPLAGPPRNENHFPIAVWLQDPRNAARYKAAGINTYVGLWNGPTEPQLAALAKAGLSVFCEQNQVGLEHRNDPVIAGWMHGDEPDNAQSLPGGKGYGPPILPAVIQRDYARIRANDPARPVLLNLGQGVAWDNYIGRGTRRNKPEDYPEYIRGSDIVSFDIYPAVHDSPEIAGRLEYVARGVERLVEWSGGSKTVWNCIECTRISNPRVKPTPAQVRSEVWMALVRGSRGLIYFVHQFKPEFREAALLDDPEMLAAVTAINREIAGLAPVLNGPSLPDAATVRSSVGSGPIALMAKRREGVLHLFAVNLANQPARATFELRGAKDAAGIEVVGESRRLSPTQGVFEDDFGPYAARHYTVAAR